MGEVSLNLGSFFSFIFLLNHTRQCTFGTAKFLRSDDKQRLIQQGRKAGEPASAVSAALSRGSAEPGPYSKVAILCCPVRCTAGSSIAVEMTSQFTQACKERLLAEYKC